MWAFASWKLKETWMKCSEVFSLVNWSAKQTFCQILTSDCRKGTVLKVKMSLLIMNNVSKKLCIQFHMCTFLLRCSDAFYNLKVYVFQNEEREKKDAKHCTIIYHDAL